MIHAEEKWSPQTEMTPAWMLATSVALLWCVCVREREGE
jgi:hypothetical protein